MAELLWWHRVGQKVAFVRSPKCPVFEGEIWPVIGIVYTVRDVCLDNDGDVFFHLDEIKNPPADETYDEPGAELWFWSCWFRPTRETSIECFRSLLAPKPEHIRELDEVSS